MVLNIVEEMQLDVTKTLRYLNLQTGCLTRIYLKKKIGL